MKTAKLIVKPTEAEARAYAREFLPKEQIMIIKSFPPREPHTATNSGFFVETDDSSAGFIRPWEEVVYEGLGRKA
jgi:hypothetical protein